MRTLTSPSHLQVAIPAAVYPHWCDTTQTGLTEPMNQLSTNVLSGHPVRMADRDGLLTVNRNYAKTLNDTAEQFKKLRLEVCRANVVTKTDESEAVLDRLQRSFNEERVPSLPALRAPVIAQGPQVMHETLSQSVKNTLTAFVQFVAGMLDCLVEKDQIGVIQWFPNNVCTFNFFQNNYTRKETDTVVHRSHVKVDRRHTETETILREVVVAHHFSRHEHDLVDASPLPLDQYPTLVPRRLQPVLQAIPTILRPYAKLVFGRQVYEGVFDTIAVAKSQNHRDEIKEWIEPAPIEQPVSRTDPCISLGNYVLGAWYEGEK